jgi:hypothetical protein
VAMCWSDYRRVPVAVRRFHGDSTQRRSVVNTSRRLKVRRPLSRVRNGILSEKHRRGDRISEDSTSGESRSIHHAPGRPRFGWNPPSEAEARPILVPSKPPDLSRRLGNRTSAGSPTGFADASWRTLCLDTISRLRVNEASSSPSTRDHVTYCLICKIVGNFAVTARARLRLARKWSERRRRNAPFRRCFVGGGGLQTDPLHARLCPKRN